MFILLHIQKQNKFIHYTYERQRMEQALQDAQQHMHATERELCELTNLANIKEYAQTHLMMDNAKLKQINQLTQ